MRSFYRTPLAYPSVLLLVLSMSVARGNFVTELSVITTPTPDGETLYSYTLTNHSDSTFNASGFVVDIAENANLRFITSPDGWDFLYDLNGTNVVWESLEPANFLLPGASLTYSFVSILYPTPDFFLVFATDDTGTILETNTGQILSPGAGGVPEPSSLILGIIGAVPIASWYFGPSVRRALGKSRPLASPLPLKAHSAQPHPK